MFAAPAMDAAPCMAKSRLADCAAPLVGLMPHPAHVPVHAARGFGQRHVRVGYRPARVGFRGGWAGGVVEVRLDAFEPFKPFFNYVRLYGDKPKLGFGIGLLHRSLHILPPFKELIGKALLTFRNRSHAGIVFLVRLGTDVRGGTSAALAAFEPGNRPRVLAGTGVQHPSRPHFHLNPRVNSHSFSPHHAPGAVVRSA